MRYPWLRSLFCTVWCCLTSVAGQAQQPTHDGKQGDVPAGAAAAAWPSGQPDDYLQPSPGYLVGPAYAADYYAKLRAVLYAGLSDPPTARVVIRPSFAPEYVMSIDQQAAAYFLTYRVCQTSL